MGAGFGRLWAAAAVSNVGDGVALAAGPLLLASLTSDPALVAGAMFVQQLPWLLFALPAGVYVDRLDRRRLIVLVNLVRAAVGGGLAVTVATGVATVAVVYAALFVVGTMETLADNASTALLPAVVPAEDLPRANARLMGVQLVGNQGAVLDRVRRDGRAHGRGVAAVRTGAARRGRTAPAALTCLRSASA